jgi:hypothetical protein
MLEEDPVVLEVVGVGLDRIRRPIDIGQIRQIPLDRLDRAVLVQDGPRVHTRVGHRHPLHLHRSSNVIHMMDEREITTSTTSISEQQTPVQDVEDGSQRASDNSALRIRLPPKQ